MNKDKLQKKLHLINFTVRALIIGVFIFYAVQMAALHFGGVHDNALQSDSSGYYGHNYCGTFFIDITRDNSFIDEQSYLNAIQPSDTPLVQNILLNCTLAITIISLLLFLNRADKQTFHNKRTAWLLLLSGGLYTVGNTFVELK